MAHFNCTVSKGYQVLIWLFNGTPILTVLGNGTPIITNPKYNQDGFQNGTEFTSGLKIFDVQLHDSGEIKCSLQNFQDDKYAFLSVQGVYAFLSSFSFKEKTFRPIARVIHTEIALSYSFYASFSQHFKQYCGI